MNTQWIPRSGVRYPVRFLTLVDFVARLKSQTVSGLQMVGEIRVLGEQGLGVYFQSTLKPSIGSFIQVGLDNNIMRYNPFKYIYLTAEVIWTKSNFYGLKISHFEGSSKHNYASILNSLALTSAKTTQPTLPEYEPLPLEKKKVA